MRKAAVFVYVEAKKILGDEMIEPYLTDLSTPQLKLIQIYYNREMGVNPVAVSSIATSTAEHQ